MLGSPVNAGVLYDFGGLRVSSAFALPGLGALHPKHLSGPVDIRLSLSTAPLPAGHPVYQYRGRYQLAFEACGEGWLFRHGDDMGVAITHAGRVLDGHCPDPARLPLLAEIVTRRVLPRISALHGRLPMHGATLGDGRGVTMLLGSSGAGKSTMTAALARYLGWGIFSDDMSIVADEGRHMVFPTTLGVSVWQQSQRALGLPPEECRPLQHYEGKAWYAPGPAAAPPPQPLDAVILLSFDAHGGGIACRRLSGPDAFVKVSSQLVAFNPRDTGAIASLVARATRLVATIPIYALSYPRDYGALPEVVDTIRRLRTEAASELV